MKKVCNLVWKLVGFHMKKACKGRLQQRLVYNYIANVKKITWEHLDSNNFVVFMDNEFYCDVKLLTFGMHCNKLISSLVCKKTWGNTFHGSSSRILHFLPAQTGIHTVWMVVKYQGVLNDFQENILASGKVLFVSLYKVWDVSLREITHI